MAKLYPPIISGTLPAFYLEESNMDRMIKITVPFTMNHAVSPTQIKGFALRIKTVQNSNYLYTAQINNAIYYNLEGSSYVTFVLKTSNNSEERELILRTLKVGLFYKLQIAYIDQNNEIGNYSSVGISKFTTKPTLYISGLKTGVTNNHIYDYIGVYSQENGDSTEKVYNYYFSLYDENSNLIFTTEDQVHDTTMDTNLYTSYDRFTYSKDFELYKPYKIQYTVITNNNLKISSPVYRIIQRVTLDSDLKAELKATANFDDGYIDIDLIGNKNELGNEDIVSGSFILSRASEEGNYLDWEKLLTFKIISQFPSRRLWRDFTAQQGKKYKYSIQQFNDDGLYSSRIISNVVFSDFEDAFLYDGERQLKIRYNPKIGNVKTNLLETKADTLGSKYPFFFRNGKVNYKEFTISGLLSYLEDDNFFFITKEELNLVTKELHRHSTVAENEEFNDSVGENIWRERLFKNKVLDWLNNGQPKIFRTPYEGNFIVRMMKTTLNPENRLGRLLHTFNGTAYEVADYSYDNLIKHNFVNVITNEDIKFLSWNTINFNEKDSYGRVVYPCNKTLNHIATSEIKFTNMRPGQMVKLLFEDTREETIMIGVTGSYSLNSQVPIAAITLLESNLTFPDGVIDPYINGQLTYSFLATTPNKFDKVQNVENIGAPAHQFIGQHDDILQEIQSIFYNGQWIKNPKNQLIQIFNIRCYRRKVQDLTQIDSKLYLSESNIEFETDKMNPTDLMRIGTYEEVQYNPIHSDYIFTPINYIDYYNNQNFKVEEYNPFIYINGNEVIVEDNDVFNFQPDELKSLSCGNGVVVEVTYYMKSIYYLIEDNDNYIDVYYAKKEYLETKYKLDKFYEIMGILGKSNGDILVIENQRDDLINQIEKDKEKITSSYDEQIAQLELNFETITNLNKEKHEKMQAYIEACIAELENLQNPTSQDKINLYQYQQAFNVEYHEYYNNYNSRLYELQKTKQSLEAKKVQMTSSYDEEIKYIMDSSQRKIDTIQENKDKILVESNELFGNINWEDLSQKINVENTLKTNERDKYNKFILGLIKSQEIQAEEEAANDE